MSLYTSVWVGKTYMATVIAHWKWPRKQTTKSNPLVFTLFCHWYVVYLCCQQDERDSNTLMFLYRAFRNACVQFRHARFLPIWGSPVVSSRQCSEMMGWRMQSRLVFLLAASFAPVCWQHFDWVEPKPQSWEGRLSVFLSRLMKQ